MNPREIQVDLPEPRRLGDDCLSDLLLDCLEAGELGRPESDTARAHLETCERCRHRAAEIQEEAADFSKEVWIAGEAARTRRALRTRGFWGGAAALGALAAAGFVLLSTPPEQAFVRTKGAETLALSVRHAGGRVAEVLPDEALRPGDAIRFRLDTEHDGYLVILGLDAAGVVTSYSPGPRALTWPAGRGQLVPGSIILDQTLGRERVVALLCDEPLEIDRAIEFGRRALRAARGDPGALGPLGSGCRELQFDFQKTAAP